MLTPRNDLLILRWEVDGEMLYIVQAPETGRSYRLREVDLFVLRRLGAPPDPEFLREVEARFGETITEDSLRRFLAVAKAMRLVEEEGGSPPRSG